MHLRIVSEQNYKQQNDCYSIGLNTTLCISDIRRIIKAQGVKIP